ncbi:unnamed protein product, partial [Musa hybrid cultivar]
EQSHHQPQPHVNSQTLPDHFAHQRQLLPLNFPTLVTTNHSSSLRLHAGGVSADVELHPVMEYYTTATPIQHRQAAAARELTPFQLCLDCRCCAANNASNCSTMPCCFGIDCNLPDKPFGVCAFVPKTCNCTSCQ